MHVFRQLAGSKLSAKHSKPVPIQSSLWQQINYGNWKRQMPKTVSIKKIRNIQLRTEMQCCHKGDDTYDKDDINYFLPVAGGRLHGNNICTVFCLTFNWKILSLDIRCTNDTSCFLHDCLGIALFSLVSAFQSLCCSPFWAEITLQPGSHAMFADKSHHSWPRNIYRVWPRWG